MDAKTATTIVVVLGASVVAAAKKILTTTTAFQVILTTPDRPTDLRPTSDLPPTSDLCPVVSFGADSDYSGENSNLIGYYSYVGVDPNGEPVWQQSSGGQYLFKDADNYGESWNIDDDITTSGGYWFTYTGVTSDPIESSNWKVWDGSAWIEQSDVTVTCANGDEVCDDSEDMLTLHMEDAYGDGWTGTWWTLFGASGELWQQTLTNGIEAAISICVPAEAEECYQIETSEGDYPSEVSWHLDDEDGNVLADGGAGDEDSFCMASMPPTPVPTDSPTITPTSAPTAVPTDACEPGTFLNTSHVDRCQPCPRGQFSDAPNSGTCTTCLAGQYAAVTGSSACSLCEIGKYLADDGLNLTKHDEPGDCKLCEGGLVSSDDRSTCEPCPAGTAVKNISSEFTCVACPLGHFSKGGTDRCEACAVGQYAPINGSSVCLRCSPPRWTSASGSPYCDACRSRYYLTDSSLGSNVEGTWGSKNDQEAEHCTPDRVGNAMVGGACCECPVGAKCKVGSTKDSMNIKEGYYRHSSKTAQILECKHSNGCAGTSTDPDSEKVSDMRLKGDDLCRVGFTGPLCSRCSDGYYYDNMNEVCVACDSKEAEKQSRSASKDIVPIVIVVLVVIALLLTVAVNRPGRLQNWWNSFEERIMTISHYLTMLVVTGQLAVNYQSVTMFYGGAPFPEPFATVVRLSEIFTLDAFALFRVGCVASGWNYSSKLYTATLSSAMVIITVFIRRLTKVLYGGRVWDGVEMKFMFLLIFFTLPTTSMIIAKAFACVEFQDGKGGTEKFLIDDMTLSCDDDNPRYRTMYGFAVTMGLAFPVGVPLAALVLLWSRRREIEERQTRMGGEELKVIAFFFRTYGPETWYWSVFGESSTPPPHPRTRESTSPPIYQPTKLPTHAHYL